MFQLEEFWMAPEWESHLKQAGLTDIEAVTTRDFEWFEKPHKRLGGWSGVTRIELNEEASEAIDSAVFLKIQNNHCYRVISRGFKRRLTFEREFDAFKGLSDVAVLPELVLFAKWRKGGDIGSILVTKALDGFVDMEEWQRVVQADPQTEEKIRQALVAIADSTRTMHATGWAHFTHKPKHVFIREGAEGDFQVRFIDFERARHPLLAKTCGIQDLTKFLRHSHYLTREQKLQFLKDYFQVETFSRWQAQCVQALENAKCLNAGKLSRHSK